MLKLKRTLITLAFFALMITSAMAVNLLTNGDFVSGSTNWTGLNEGYPVATTEDYAYAGANLPGTATAPAYNAHTTSSGEGQKGGMGIYQSVALEAGKIYTLYGAIRSVGSTQFWCEFYILDQTPTQGIEVNNTNYPTGLVKIASLKEDPWGAVGLIWNPYNGLIEGLTPMVYPATGPNFVTGFPISTTGTYRFIIVYGCDGTGKICDITLDNLVLEETAGTVPAELSVFSAE